MTRGYHRGLIHVILVAVLAAAAPPAHAQELKFGFTPVPGEVDMRAEREPLVTYLSNAIGRMVSLYAAKDDDDLRTRMEAGAVDVGSFSPLAYVHAARGGKIRVIAQSVLEGSATYRGVIIKRFDSGINSLTDLQGKRFAFVDRTSASGYLYPRAMLIEKGVAPERSFKETIFAGSHERVIAAVLVGPAHAGATSPDAVEAAKTKGLPTFDLEILAKTEPIPHDAIAVRNGLEETLVMRIQSALVELNKSTAGRDAMARSRRKLTGHVRADDSAFDGVRQTIKIGGL